VVKTSRRRPQLDAAWAAQKQGLPPPSGTERKTLRGRRNNRKWRERARRWGRLVYLRLVRQHGEPDRVAKGLGLGVFLGIFPTFGVGTVLAVLLATWVKWNRASAALGTFIMNPFFNPFFLSLSVIVGNLLVPPQFRIAVETFRNGKLWSGFLRAAPVYLLGNLLVSTFFALLAYALGFAALVEYRRKRAARAKRAGGPEPSSPPGDHP